jgi:hypothetical protein
VGFLESNKTIVVAFEGSETVMNWLTDFDFIKKPYPAFPNASVHEVLIVKHVIVAPS